MRFARWVFLLAGISGILMVLPLYYQESEFNRQFPPDLNHPEYYYGFAGVCLAWQVMFLVIGRDPVRFRPAMIPAVLEKLGFVVAVPVLYVLERVSPVWLAFAAHDCVWLILFVIAFIKTPRQV